MAWQPRFPFLLLANIRIFILDYEVLGQAHTVLAEASVPIPANTNGWAGLPPTLTSTCEHGVAVAEGCFGIWSLFFSSGKKVYATHYNNYRLDRYGTG